jgi:hypothetical protein
MTSQLIFMAQGRTYGIPCSIVGLTSCKWKITLEQIGYLFSLITQIFLFSYLEKELKPLTLLLMRQNTFTIVSTKTFITYLLMTMFILETYRSLRKVAISVNWSGGGNLLGGPMFG